MESGKGPVGLNDDSGALNFGCFRWTPPRSRRPVQALRMPQVRYCPPYGTILCTSKASITVELQPSTLDARSFAIMLEMELRYLIQNFRSERKVGVARYLTQL